jgi:acetolactate synthase I/II/III large subunit
VAAAYQLAARRWRAEVGCHDHEVATELMNPDFAVLAQAFGGHGERVERPEEFASAFERALASGRPAILHRIVDPQALTPTATLDTIRERAMAKS